MRKLKNSKRDENDILKFVFKIEWACDLGTQNDLERIACSIAIKRLRILTQPGPIGTSELIDLDQAFLRFAGKSFGP